LYELKTPFRDGTAQLIFEPLDLLARWAALSQIAISVNPSRISQPPSPSPTSPH
jgi:hypothetical protein